MEDFVQEIITAEDIVPEVVLDDFLKSASTLFTFTELDINNTRTELWKMLYKMCDIAPNNIKLKSLSAIRILSRDKNYLGSLVTEDWLKLLQKLAALDGQQEIDSENLSIVIESLKCLSNICLNSISAAKRSYELNILDKLMHRIEQFETISSDDVQFFDAKLVFIISAVRPEIRKKIRDDLNGVPIFTKELNNILQELEKLHESKLSDTQVNLSCEILKALFNITLSIEYTDSATNRQDCDNLVDILRQFILMPTLNNEKRALLQNDIVNVLVNMGQSYEHLLTTLDDKECIGDELKYENYNMSAYYELLKVLEQKFHKETGVSKQYEVLSPTLTVLLKSAINSRIIRKYLKEQILPPLKDVHNLPEEGNTLRNYMCKLLTSPITQLKNIVAELLFVLCKKNVNRMIKYTGYGNAAGLFAQRGLLGGKMDSEQGNYSTEDDDSETEEYAELKHGINPVLGRYEEPRPDPMQNMTDEQKEYEAMKLVQLIDDMTKCGAIKPCRVGPDGKPVPIEHVLELQAGLKQNRGNDEDSD